MAAFDFPNSPSNNQTCTAGNSSTTQTGTNANLPPYYTLCYIIKV